MIAEKENSLRRLKNDILPVLPRELAEILGRVPMQDLEQLEEIRLRADKPLMLQNYRREWFVRPDGSLGKSPEKAVIVTPQNMSGTLERLCEN